MKTHEFSIKCYVFHDFASKFDYEKSIHRCYLVQKTRVHHAGGVDQRELAVELHLLHRARHARGRADLMGTKRSPRNRLP